MKKNENRYSISEAAKLANMTSGTLRHYDHIGLVSPHEKDPWTGYRYYSDQEIVRLNTIQTLQLMDISLKEIQEILKYNDIEKIITFFRQAEKNADDKIKKLQYAKSKIERARSHYEKKLSSIHQGNDIFTQKIPERMILLSDTMHHPTVENLSNYHNHFYDQIEESQKSEFTFEDLAGIYIHEGNSQLFVLCTRYPGTNKLTILPEGLYLCANCTDENKENTLALLMETARVHYGVTPTFTIQLVIVSGILQWVYQMQILLEREMV